MGFSKEPALWIGTIATIVVLIAQQVISSGIVSNAGTIQWLGLIVSVVPLIAAAITRQLVTPANP